MKRYKYLINYINQYGIRTSVVMSQAMLKVLEVLSNLEGMTKEKYLGKIAKKNNEGVSNTLFIRDYMVNELLKIITEVAEGLAQAIMHADPRNTKKIHDTCPEYWKEGLDQYIKTHTSKE